MRARSALWRVQIGASSGRFLAPLIALGTVLGATGASSRWRGSWDATVVVTTNYLTLMLPLVVLAGAIDGRRDRAGVNVHAWSRAARPRLALAVGRLLATSVWTVGGYLLALVVCLARTAQWSPEPTASPPLVLLGAAAVLAYSALGLVLGRLLPMIAVIAVAVLVGLPLNGILAGEPGTVASVFATIDDGATYPYARVLSAVALGQTLFLLGLSLALVGAAAAHGSWTRGALLPLGLGAVVVAVGVALALSAGGARSSELVASADRWCTVDQPSVCTLRDHRYLQAGLTAAVRGLGRDAPPGLLPTAYVENGLAVRRSEVQVTIAASELPADRLADQLAGATVSYVLGCSAGEAPGQDRGLAAAYRWLAARAYDATFAGAPIGTADTGVGIFGVAGEGVQDWASFRAALEGVACRPLP